MNFTNRTYSAEEILDMIDGVSKYEIVSVVANGHDRIDITCAFRFSISQPDKDGDVSCVECVNTFSHLQRDLIAKTGDLRVTVEAKDNFKSLLASRHSVYSIELSRKNQQDLAVTKIETDMREAVSDVFSR